MILLRINAVLRIEHWYRNHNYSDFFIGVIQSLSSLPKGTQALGTRLEKIQAFTAGSHSLSPLPPRACFPSPVPESLPRRLSIKYPFRGQISRDIPFELFAYWSD